MFLQEFVTGRATKGLYAQIARILRNSEPMSRNILPAASFVTSHPPAAALPLPHPPAGGPVLRGPAPTSAWYTVREEERLPDGETTPTSSFGADEGAFESHHPSKRFANVLSQLRTRFPNPVWQIVTDLFPGKDKDPSNRPVCVDIAVGAEGRGGVELARRGFHVIGVEATPALLARTFEFAQAHNAHIELMTAKVEHSLLADDSADVVTFLHGLHLVDTHAALHESWRLLKPGHHLVAAFNDRDLNSDFICELEDVMERHVASYNRYHKQRSLEDWGERLQEGGLFKLERYSVHPNPIPMANAAALLDVLDCMSFIRANLRGEARKRFNMDVRALLERRFGHRPFVLPLETKVYVLKKVSRCSLHITLHACISPA